MNSLKSERDNNEESSKTRNRATRALFLGWVFLQTANHEGQQNNVAARIVRNYDVQEIEFISFTKNESTGSYILNVKINNNENKEISMLISDLKFLEQPDGDLLLGPIEEFQDIKRAEQITGKIDLSKIKIKYIGEK